MQKIVLLRYIDSSSNILSVKTNFYIFTFVAVIEAAIKSNLGIFKIIWV
jgi:hypothetical protein